MANTATLSAWLGDNPQAVFQRSLSGMSPQMSRFFSSNYNDIYGKYMGTQAAQAAGGEMPSGDFGGFLQNYPWLQQYYSYTPYQRGFSQARMAPTTRFLQY